VVLVARVILDRAPDNRAEIEIHHLEGELADIEARNVEQIVDQPQLGLGALQGLAGLTDTFRGSNRPQHSAGNDL